MTSLGREGSRQGKFGNCESAWHCVPATIQILTVHTQCVCKWHVAVTLPNAIGFHWSDGDMYRHGDVVSEQLDLGKM